MKKARIACLPLILSLVLAMALPAGAATSTVRTTPLSTGESSSDTIASNSATSPGTPAQSALQSIAPVRLDGYRQVPAFRADFLPASGLWKSMVAGIQPGTFRDVTYTLQDNVVEVKTPITPKIRTAAQILTGSAIPLRKPMDAIAQGAFIQRDVLRGIAGDAGIRPGTVFFETGANIAFKTVTPLPSMLSGPGLDGNVLVSRPQIHEVLKDFAIPSQLVDLTEANITGFGDPDIEPCIVQRVPGAQLATDTYDTLTHIEDPLIEFVFPKGTELNASLGDGTQIVVKVSGGLGIGEMELDGAYSGFGGYHIGLKSSQEAYLKVEVGLETHQEIRIPIYGFDVSFGVGRVTGGLFLVAQMDGKLTVEIQARAWATETVGVGGGTFLYVPTNVSPYVSVDELGVQGDVFISASINGEIKAGALVGIELLGWDLAGAGALAGAGITIATDGAMLNVEMYGKLNAYITLLGNQFDLLNLKIPIFERKQTDMGSYRVRVEEACAYQDRVGGLILYDYGGNDGYLPEPNAQVQVEVTPTGGGAAVLYPSADTFYTTDAYGEFIGYDIPLTMGDDVRIKVKRKDTGTLVTSEPVQPTFPFKRVQVTDADYFNDFVIGEVVPAKVRKWGVHSEKEEDEYEYIRYAGDVTVRIMKPTMSQMFPGVYGEYVFGQEVETTANTDGLFKAEGLTATDGTPMDVHPESQFDCSIEFEGFLVTTRSVTEPKVQFALKRVTELMPNGASRYMEGDRTVDRMVWNERYYLINLRGSRQVSAGDVEYELFGYSTQDRYSNHFMHWTIPGGTQTDPVMVCDKAGNYLPGLYPDTAHLQVVPETTQDGQPNGASMIDSTIITEWVWQAHSTPTRFTSADHHASPAGGSTFQVSATGVQAIAYSADKLPQGVSLAATTGFMTIDPATTPGTYAFRLTATPGTKPETTPQVVGTGSGSGGNGAGDAAAMVPGATALQDPFLLFGGQPAYTEDIPPVATQDFTLTVEAGTANSASPSPAATPSPTPKPTPEPTPTPTPTATPTPTPSPEPTPTPTPEPTPSPSTEPTPTPEPTPSPTPSRTPLPTRPSIDPGLPFLKAPVITSADTFACTTRGGSFQVTATGKTPIVYSLAPISARVPVPTQVEIERSTGRMTVAPGIAAGTYVFYVRAGNGISPDAQQTFTLTVTSLVLRSLGSYGDGKDAGSPVSASVALEADAGSPVAASVAPEADTESPAAASPVAANVIHEADTARPLFVFGDRDAVLRFGTPLANGNTGTGFHEPAVAPFSAQNTFTLRNDDPEDLYDSDSLWVQGAEYVKWDGILTIHIEGKPIRMSFLDGSPSADHHLHTISEEDREKIGDFYKELETVPSAWGSGSAGLGGPGGADGPGGLGGLGGIGGYGGSDDGGFIIPINPVDQGWESTVLDFGDAWQLIGSGQGGSARLDLNGKTGTLVPGTLFEGLAGKSDTSLVIGQKGATITFQGTDVAVMGNGDGKSAQGGGLYDFAFAPEAPHQSEMLAAAGLSAGVDQAFTFSFAHNGALPGYGAFSIDTGITAGTMVQVYRFDGASGSFSLIAEGVKVDGKGAVTYHNNTTSEYLITTKLLAGVPAADAASHQTTAGRTTRTGWIPWAIGGVAGLAALGAVVVILMARRRKKG